MFHIYKNIYFYYLFTVLIYSCNQSALTYNINFSDMYTVENMSNHGGHGHIDREDRFEEISSVNKSSPTKKRLKIFGDRSVNSSNLNFSRNSVIGNSNNSKIDKENLKIRLSIIGNKFYNKILAKLIEQKEEEVNRFHADGISSFNENYFNNNSSEWLICLINSFFELDAVIARKIPLDESLKLRLENKNMDSNKLSEKFLSYWSCRDINCFEKFIEEVFSNTSNGINKVYSLKDKNSINSLLSNLEKSSFWKNLILDKIFENRAVVEKKIPAFINNLDDSFGFKTPEKSQRYYGYAEEL